MPSSSTGFEVITNQPSPRSSTIPLDDTHPPDIVPDPLKEPLILQNGEMDSKSRFTITQIRNDQPIGPFNLPENEMIPLSDATDASNGTANKNSQGVVNPPIKTSDAPKSVGKHKGATAISEKCNQTAANKNNQNNSINGPNVHPGAETTVGLSLCMLQLCNLCTGCCDDFDNWCCCCCCTDSELCVSCCTGCMECCTACDCCCN